MGKYFWDALITSRKLYKAEACNQQALLKIAFKFPDKKIHVLTLFTSEIIAMLHCYGIEYHPTMDRADIKRQIAPLLNNMFRMLEKDGTVKQITAM